MPSGDVAARRCGADREAASIAFLFLGELFLIPHLLPIAVALARRRTAITLTLLVSTSTHEEILREALAIRGIDNVTVRRVRGFRRQPASCRDTPLLPNKLLLLLANALSILRHDVVVVAERTSLWLPHVARVGAAFVYNEHGAGPHANFASARNRRAARILVPGAGMEHEIRAAGHRDPPIRLVGYIKRDYIREQPPRTPMPMFREPRQTVLYAPHWLEHKSSWWAMGEEVLAYFARSRTYNLVVAPHARLPTRDAGFARKVRCYRDCPNIHIDATSFRLIDRSYVDAADIYLGDGSSQVLEFAERPRPAIFLNPAAVDWQRYPRFGHWCMGEVVEDVAGLDRALARADDAHPGYLPVQEAYVAHMMGCDDGLASERAADAVLDLLAERRAGRRGMAA